MSEINNMEPFEKERIFGEELNLLIDRFCSEYQMTYVQVIGCLEVIKAEMVNEGFMDSDEDDE